MNLKKLIAKLPIKIYKGKDVEITGLSAHSKSVAPGNLFIAKKGRVDDREKYIEEAIEAGAVAVLTDLPNPFLTQITQLIHPCISDIEGILAARFYGFPSQKLYTVGVTGTNGKTTITFLTKHLFEKLGISTGLIGTIEYMIGAYHLPAERTTPDVVTNHRLLHEMYKHHCEAAVLEVSSHGLAQRRCDQIAFDVAVFSNLSQDHLDYHLTMEAYAQEKAKLFTSLDEDKIAIVCFDSAWKEHILSHCRAKVMTYGFSPEADVYVTDIELGMDNTSFTVHFHDELVRFQWNLVGRFNILNGLAALTICLSKGIPLTQLPPHFATFDPVAGRLERVENQHQLHIYVDYAHTPQALECVLSTLSEISKGKIITVFGCGGDRDKNKRPLMGRAVEEGSDFAFITSDNPRSEDPTTICSEIAAGFMAQNYRVIVDRKEAIKQAIAMANPEDVILIAGKGHETYQIFAHQTIPFDDRTVAKDFLQQLTSTHEYV